MGQDDDQFLYEDHDLASYPESLEFPEFMGSLDVDSPALSRCAELQDMLPHKLAR